MSESKHTPGPWAFGLIDATDPKHGFSVNDFGRGHLNATVHVGGLSDLKEDEANARLIAAAPDLLTALKKALAVLQKLDLLRHIDPMFPELDEANAAIAKTEGRES